MTKYIIKIELSEDELFSQTIQATIKCRSNLAKKELGKKIIKSIENDFTNN